MGNKKRRGRGEGSLYELDGRWVASVVIGYSPNGNAIRRTRSCKTKDEAKKKLLELQQKHQAGHLGVRSMTVKELFEFWLDSIVKVDPGTLSLYRQRITDYVYPYLGHINVAKLNAFVMSQFYKQLKANGQSADMQSKVGQLLRTCLQYGMEKLKLVSENAAADFPLPTVVKQEMRPLDEDQLKKFLHAARKCRLFVLFLMAVDTGMRQGELIALEWVNVDLTTGVVSVRKSARKEKGGMRIKDVKTTKSKRSIRLTHRTLAALSELRAGSSSAIVFTTKKGQYVDKGNLRITFRRILKNAGLPMIRFHDLRHTHATLMLMKTKNIKAVSARLGHADIRITLNTYAHLIPAMEDEIVAAMEEMLTPESGQEKSKCA